MRSVPGGHNSFRYPICVPSFFGSTTPATSPDLTSRRRYRTWPLKRVTTLQGRVPGRRADQGVIQTAAWVRFELTERFPVRRFSRPLHSTTLPPRLAGKVL